MVARHGFEELPDRSGSAPRPTRNAAHGLFRRSRDLPSGRAGILAALDAVAGDAVRAARLFPAQEYVPLRSEAYLSGIADLLNSAPFGVVFNAYDPRQGTGALFGNAAAGLLWSDGDLRPIAGEAVAAALWLSLYGFEGLPGGLMDGAYQRPCIVAELHRFDRIYAVRPLAQGWRGKVPATWLDVQDWQCEMWFSAGYAAEVADMARINQLIEEGALTDPRFRKIQLIGDRPPSRLLQLFHRASASFRCGLRQSP